MTKPLFDAFRQTMLNYPSASRKEQMDAFIEAMASDPRNLALLAADYFERMSAVWTVKEHRISQSVERTAVSDDKVTRMALARKSREDAKARNSAAAEALTIGIRNLLLLDLIMPSGKRLREATGAECTRAGGFYAEIAKRIKPTQTVDRNLTEGDLQNIKARFYQQNREKVA